MRLALEGIGKRYGSALWALRDVSFTLGPGVVGLLGPNGAGKSTLMRILATITKPTTGHAIWEDADLVRHPDSLRPFLGYLPQDFGVYPNLNVVEFLEYLAAVKGVDARQARGRIDALLDTLNLADVRRRPLGSFSGGMRQRVGIAQALLNDPQLLIVDEPTAGLDPEERVRFRHLLAELAGERVVLLSTHIVSDVEAVATRLIVIDRGQVIAHDAPEELLREAEGHVFECVVPSDQVTELRRSYLVTRTMNRSDGVLVRVVAAAPPRPDAVPVAAALEDAYLGRLASHRAKAAA
jgi:ABC-type multidrug transport system ATPase subunit